SSPGSATTVTTAAITPMIASTTSSSMRVNPRGGSLQVPRADVRIESLASRRAIRAEAEYVDLAAQSRIEVLVRMAPGIARQPLQVAAGFPVRRHGRQRWALDQGAEPLLRGRIAQVVQPVQLQPLQQGGDILSRRHYPRLVRSAHDPWHDKRRENCEDRDHHHDLDESKRLDSASTHGTSALRGDTINCS